MQCCVESCKRRKKFKFPKAEAMKKKWLEAILKPNFKPKPWHGLCENHFRSKDILTESLEGGYELQKTTLRRTAVPSIFPWSSRNQENSTLNVVSIEESKEGDIETDQDTSNEYEIISEECTSNVVPIEVKEKDVEVDHDTSNEYGEISEECTSNVVPIDVKEKDVEVDHDTSNEYGEISEECTSNHMDEDCDSDCEVYPYADDDLYVASNVDIDDLSLSTNISYDDNSSNVNISNEKLKSDSEKQTHSVNNTRDKSTQSNANSRIVIEDLQNDPAAVLHFTGLEDYTKFMTVFTSLDPKVEYIEYEENRCFGGLSLENQLFLTLWKLRRNCPDYELSFFFGITKTAVGNIFKAWVIFMAKQWSRIDIWPSKELTYYYMPRNFKTDFPKTRVIIDGTEIHAQRPRNPKHQQCLFSHYKNAITLKGVVENTAGGLISYCSPLYAGSTSDRQVVERSELLKKCEPGDTIMADRGFTVQDMFAPLHVTVLTPHFTKGKGYLPQNILLKDRKLSKYRVHVERIIGLLKTYKIMSSTLHHSYISMASEITGVCVMLCNFKECIMKAE